MGRADLHGPRLQQRQLPHLKQHLGPVAPSLIPAHAPTPMDQLPLVGRLLNPKPGETIVDLGCGDGRVCIYLAETYGCRCVGYEIDDDQLRIAREAVRMACVAHLVDIRKQDVRQADLSGADGAYVYLYPDLLEELAEALSRVPRVVSYQHAIPGQRKLEDFYVRP